MNIDKLKEVLTEFEGVRLEAYIPKRGGVPIQSSGVTIGKGLDLGQQSVESLRRMNIPDYLIERFKPYLGLKGRDAAKALALATREKRVPTITKEEERLVSDNSVRDYAKNFQADFKKYVGYDVSELSENQQLSLASMYFQNGVGSSKSRNEGGKTGLFIRNKEDAEKYGSPTTNFLQQLKDRDFQKAAGNISTWSNDPSLKERNWVTSLLFMGGLDSDQLQEGRKFVQDRGVQASLKQGQLPEELTAPFVVGEPEGIIGIPFERPAPLSREADVYTVRQGDTLSDIAQRAGLSLQNLITYNKDAGLVDNPDKIFTGQDLLIPPSEVKLDEDAFANEFMSYRPEYM